MAVGGGGAEVRNVSRQRQRLQVFLARKPVVAGLLLAGALLCFVEIGLFNLHAQKLCNEQLKICFVDNEIDVCSRSKLLMYIDFPCSNLFC